MPRLLEVVLGDFPRRPIHEFVQPGLSQLAVLVLHAVWAVAQNRAGVIDLNLPGRPAILADLEGVRRAPQELNASPRGLVPTPPLVPHRQPSSLPRAALMLLSARTNMPMTGPSGDGGVYC